MQDAAAHHDAAAGGLPGGPVRHGAELSAGARPHDHVRRAMRLGHERFAEAELVEHREPVRGDVQEEPRIRVGRRGGLVDLDIPPDATEEERDGRTGDAASDDEGAWHGMLLGYGDTGLSLVESLYSRENTRRWLRRQDASARWSAPARSCGSSWRVPCSSRRRWRNGAVSTAPTCSARAC